MDILLKQEMFAFSIDEIYKGGKDYFSLRILPDINSIFFPPIHTRTINVSSELLDEAFYRAVQEPEDIPPKEFTSSVKQGGYYRIPTKSLIAHEAFNPDTIINRQSDIFKGYMEKTSRYVETDIAGDTVFEAKEATEKLSDKHPAGDDQKVYLYCFNVGQGDSFLLITSNKNAYIIDTNQYSEASANSFIDKLKRILSKHGIPKIKGLIITHKHLDHLRGSAYILESDAFQVDHFFINKDYSHPTKPAQDLLNTAKEHIVNWINVNNTFDWREGDTVLRICNPICNPKMSTVNAPNINDSSIYLQVRFHENAFFLTGDASYNVLYSELEDCLEATAKNGRGALYDRLLKVSHHGSDTGTNDTLLMDLLPTHFFISAGTSRKYNHPHKKIVGLIENHLRCRDLKISKMVRKDVCYTADGKTIECKILQQN